MKYYIAADGGGTKLQMVLYDETFHVVNSTRMTGTNSGLRPAEQIVREMSQVVEQLIPDEITEIEGADLSVQRYEKELLDILKRRCSVKSYCSCGEGNIALAAAGAPFGIVAQSGTGSDAFLIQRKRQECVGGWGFMLGDEGSGYEIGHNTLKSAIYAYDGRGPKTAILDLLMEEWKLSQLWDLVEKLGQAADYHQVTANAAVIAAKAAKEKDAVALEIYERAAHEMSRLVFAAIDHNQGSWEGPIVASGGAWKGCRQMFEHFCAEIQSRYPEAEIRHPVFEPVIGCAVMRRFAAGEAFDQFREKFQKQFHMFLYQKEVEK